MNRTINKPIKRIAIIHDLVGFGKAGMMNIIPVLSSLGIECCPIPTSLFSTHTAYEKPNIKYLYGYIRDTIKHYKSLNISFDAVLIGYMGNEEIVDEVLEIIDYFVSMDSAIIFDPIFADNNKLYGNIKESYVEKLKLILPYCNLVMPNYTEAYFISKLKEPQKICDWFNKNGVNNIIITSIQDADDDIGIALYDDNYTLKKFEKHKNNFSGTGDIFSGLITGYFVLGYSLIEAVDMAHKFVYNCIMHSSNYDYDKKEGIILESNLVDIVRR